MYSYIKALHIIFVVTWFAGLFYIPRLMIYIIEANEKPEKEKVIIQEQLVIMLKRLWWGITWPSAILTLIFGLVVTFSGDWFNIIFEKDGQWFLLKLVFVGCLYLYHYSLQILYSQILQKKINYSSQQIRYWNEIPTILLFSIVFLVVVKQLISFFWSILGLFVLIGLILFGIWFYKKTRK